jgi:fermentation-respiration switch protein FrsA (DUF1100 family)
MTAPTPNRQRNWPRLVRRWVLFLGLLWLGAVVVLKALENRLVYFPLRAAESWNPPPDPQTEDVWLTASDGTKLHAWFLPHDGPGAVLVSHGNGGNLSHRGALIQNLHRHLGRSVIAYDYPGYGKSDGAPTESGCYLAGEAAYRWLTGERKVPAGRVVLLGESLGGGVAVELATRHDHEALALVFPFTSLPAAAKCHYPWVPCGLLMANRYDNLSKIGTYRRPVFITHGTADEVIPFSLGKELFEAANEPKRFLPLDGATHNGGLDERFYTELRRFLDETR